MSFYIYGLRIGGDTECRYVGQTAYDPQSRLESLTSQAVRRKRTGEQGYGAPLNPDGFILWLANNFGNVEAFKIAKVETRDEARATEKAIVSLVLRLDHRLFNRQLVPADRRIDWRIPGNTNTRTLTPQVARTGTRRSANKLPRPAPFVIAP